MTHLSRYSEVIVLPNLNIKNLTKTPHLYILDKAKIKAQKTPYEDIEKKQI